MIVIASDKFKGTLSSLEAGEAIRNGLSDLCGQDIRVVAMADGGEGTALALGAKAVSDGYYEFSTPDGATNAYVPSCGEGMPWFESVRRPDLPLRQRSSYEVGAAIRRAAESGRFRRVYIGIGGTMTADGGLGMLEGMGYAVERDHEGLPLVITAPGCLENLYKTILTGFADVSAPIYSDNGLSAMSFISQKGADCADTEWCKTLFKRLGRLYNGKDHFGGAGGGIGFALESIVGCTIGFGAPAILEKSLCGLAPKLIITGEGRVDWQTLGGKTVSAVYGYAERQGIPAVTFCGSMAEDIAIDNIFPCVKEGAPLPSDPYESLLKTAGAARPYIAKLL